LLGHRFLDGEKIEAGPLDDLAERRVVLVLAVAEMADIPRRERRRGGGQRDDEKQRDRVEAGTYPGGAARREADGPQQRTKRDRQRTAAGFGSQVLDRGRLRSSYPAVPGNSTQWPDSQLAILPNADFEPSTAAARRLPAARRDALHSNTELRFSVRHDLDQRRLERAGGRRHALDGMDAEPEPNRLAKARASRRAAGVRPGHVCRPLRARRDVPDARSPGRRGDPRARRRLLRRARRLAGGHLPVESRGL